LKVTRDLLAEALRAEAHAVAGPRPTIDLHANGHNFKLDVCVGKNTEDFRNVGRWFMLVCA